ncbi:glycosyltransferase family 2 protein [Paenirhodobacter enshiensis]|uniref:Glycosyltransferase n=1 Tax=Paenirhodobacter enshiensis TaxID=1105367 RepID=A0A086XQ68_9RHOB|nr:glycosyltransferase family 2 protein [Paenirhodobacter enshiensis]KFI24168.1 glycosyltransferase [Paenirhodobacter enshiensis]
MSGGRPRLVSIIVPCYNEEEVLDQTLGQLLALQPPASVSGFEFIFVDDGSSDGTMAKLRRAAELDNRVRAIEFSRNFGHQIAVTAGVEAASGEAVALIDADLQDPPGVLIEMIERWAEGYDVVYGMRRSREGESQFKRHTARAFYRLLNRLSEVPIPLDTGDFRVMDRRVVEVLLAMPERHRFVRGMVAWVGFRQLAVPYDRKKRAAGVSKYPLRKMLKFASDGILSFSSKPLDIATYLGFIAAILALAGVIYAIVMRIFTSNWVEGWTALMIAVLFLGGAQLISIGLIGEYIGRIYEETKKRPLYVVRERLGFGRPESVERDKVRDPDRIRS